MATKLGKRPLPKNYATYDPKGKAQYRKDLAEYLKKKAAIEKEKNKLSTKKNIEKQKTSNKKASTAKPKTTAKPKVTPKATATKGKSLATGKTTSKTKAVETPKVSTTKRRASTTKPKRTVKPKVKPAAVKPAKPLISNKNKLRIKKAAVKTVDTTKKVAKRAVDTTKKNVSKLKTKGKELLNKKSPTKRPVTTGQKLAAKGNQVFKKTGKYIKNQVLPKAKKDLVKLGKGILKDPKSLVKGVKGAGIAYVAEKGINQLVDRGIKQIRPETRGKNMTLKEYRERVEKAKKEADAKYGIIPTTKKIINKVRGKNNNLSTNKNINKQKKNNNSGLKTKKSEYSSKVNNNKNYSSKTATKKYNPKFATFREDAKANTKLQLEIQNQKGKKNKTETYSRVLSPEAKKQKSNNKKNSKLKIAKPGSARAKLIAKNEARFGKARVDKLRRKNTDFQAMKKKKMTKAEFIRKYPNSQTAKRAKGLIK